MSVIHIDGFTYLSDTDLQSFYSYTGTPTTSNMNDRRSCAALLLANGESITHTAACKRWQPETFVVGFAFQQSVGSSTGDIFQVKGAGGTNVAFTLKLDSGSLKLYKGDSSTGTLLLTTDSALGTVPYYITIECKVSSTSGYGRVIVSNSDGGLYTVKEFIGNTDTGSDVEPCDTWTMTNGTASTLRFTDWYILDATEIAHGLKTSLSNPGVAAYYGMAEYDREWSVVPPGNSWEAVFDPSGSNGDTDYVLSGNGSRESWLVSYGTGASINAYCHAQRMFVVAKGAAGGERLRPMLRLYEPDGRLKRIDYGKSHTLTTSYAPYAAMWADGIDDCYSEFCSAVSQVTFSAWGYEANTASERITHFVVYSLFTESAGGVIEDPDVDPPASGTAAVTQVVVQTMSSGENYNQALVTQVVVQTLTGAGESTIPRDDPWAGETVDPDVKIGAAMQLVAEITLTIDSAGSTQTYLVTDGESFTTKPTDNPANQTVYDRLTKPATMDRSMFGNRSTLGAVNANYGVCEIANLDGMFDAMVDYNAAGNLFVLRAGHAGAAYPSEWTTVLRATMQTIEGDLSRIVIRLRDRLELMNQALLRDTLYTDPFLIGRVFNVKCKLIDAANLIYAVGRPPDGKLVVIDAVRDEGSAIRHSSGGLGDSTSAAADEATLNGMSVAQGYFNWDPNTGRLKLGSKPYGVLTASAYVIDDTASWSATDGPQANGKIGTQLVQLAQRAGILLADCNIADANLVDIACGTTPFGYWTDGDERILAAMNALAESIGVWFGFDRLNNLRMSQLSAPSGDNAWSFTQHNILENGLKRVATQDPGRGVPVWRVVARTNKNNAPQQSFSATVKESDKALMAEEYPVEIAVENEDVLLYCPTATELVFESQSAPAYSQSAVAFVQADDAGEAERRLAMYGGNTEMVEVEAFASPLLLTSVDLGDVVRLKFNRYGWDDGEQFVVVGIKIE